MPDTGYAIALTFSALSAIFVLLATLRRKNTPGSAGLILSQAAIAVWSATYALRWLQTGPGNIAFWLDATYFGVVTVPTALFLMTAQYTGMNLATSRRFTTALWIEPAATLILLWTDPLHGLFYGGKRAPGAILDGGLWFYINAVYSYGLNLISAWILIQKLRKVHGLEKKQTATLLLGLALPWIGNGVSLLGASPFPGLDLTPFIFSISGVVFLLGLTRYRLFDIVPVARDFLVETMPEGLVVIDDKRRIIDMNPSALTIFGLKQKSSGSDKDARPFEGKDPVSILPGWPADWTERKLPAADSSVPEDGFELRKGSTCHEVRISPFESERGQSSGWLALLRDISARKKAEEELVYRSQHDILTGLYNRHYFELWLTDETLPRNRATGFIMFDLDNLKTTNDSGGHAAGDLVLVVAAVILSGHAKPGNILARIGGDEFVLAIPEAKTEDIISRVEDIRNDIREYNANPGKWIESRKSFTPLLTSNQEYVSCTDTLCPDLGMSIGIALRVKSEPLQSTLRRADAAMYRDKNRKHVLADNHPEHDVP